ncbi:nucleoside triphosphate pyrophosphohydrolase [Floricoccus penangensis]|uniref:Uncharacterized protein n=1 Tax=Floricoccus penangensis TaxID=1859475 RepID=A0A9Q5JFM3_9LACT|nr:nucleoside triphosphate pyrophosphohydrolase [Floricoccus penangensis]OFI46062.1 hypothetical protein BG262_06140 [Floricoccus penangensis]URZ88405.1 nucleoside triphosphate pyrophosphohydrolase [Floricoccus penangensis]
MGQTGKLVRDNLQEKIKSSNPEAEFDQLQGVDLQFALREKVIEEFSEFMSAETPAAKTEEAADLIEVLESLLKTYNVSKEELYDVKDAKRILKGSFEDGIFWKTEKNIIKKVEDIVDQLKEKNIFESIETYTSRDELINALGKIDPENTTKIFERNKGIYVFAVLNSKESRSLVMTEDDIYTLLGYLSGEIEVEE